MMHNFIGNKSEWLRCVTWSVSRSSSSFFMISGVGTLSSSSSLSVSSCSSTGGGGGGVEQAGDGGVGGQDVGGAGRGGSPLSPPRGSQGSLPDPGTHPGVGCRVLADWIAFLMSLIAAATEWGFSGDGGARSWEGGGFSGAGEGGGSLVARLSRARILEIMWPFLVWCSGPLIPPWTIMDINLIKSALDLILHLFLGVVHFQLHFYNLPTEIVSPLPSPFSARSCCHKSTWVSC